MIRILDSPIFAWFCIALITSLYIPLNKRRAISYITSHWDTKIPFIPSWAYVYIAYYPFVIFSCLLLPLDQRIGLPFTISYLIGSMIAVTIWYIFPSGVKRPTLNTLPTFHHKILRHIYTHDRDTNAIPSGHVLHALICSYYVAAAFPHFAFPAYLCSALITLSTVLVKQHYLFDIPVGILVGTIGILAGKSFIG